MRKTEAQRDDKTSKESNQDSNPVRLTLLPILSTEEASWKQGSYKKKGLGRVQNQLALRTLCNGWFKQLQWRVWLLAGELPPPAGCVCLLHAFDCFLFNWMEGAPLCKGAMITEISAKLLNYAWHMSTFPFFDFVLLSPLPPSKGCSAEQILNPVLTNFFYETSQENLFFNLDKFGIHWSGKEAKVKLIRIQSPDKTIIAAEETYREDVCPWKIFEISSAAEASHCTVGSEEPPRIQLLGK